MSQSPTQDTLTRALHRALRHLYDPVELRLNPLAGWLKLTRGDTPSTLRSALLDAIAALKPGPRVPEDSNAWRVYQVLCFRFEEQSSQDDVAAQMAISARQVRRLEQTAIRALASQIAAKYGLRLEAEQSFAQTPVSVQVEPGTTPIEDKIQSEHEQELDWLRRSYTPDHIDVYQLVASVFKTSEPMLARAGGSVSIQLPSGLPPVNGQATTLRQILLNLLLAAASAALKPLVGIEARSSGRALDLLFSTAYSAAGQPVTADNAEYLTLARRLAELSGGAVEQLPAPTDLAFLARLTLPAAEIIPILFVDDNDDSLRLFERSLVGTRYAFAGVRDPLLVIEQAEESGARAIILDIMLPEIDGWEILGRLRTHPRLGSVPVVISTILPHAQLAFSLGASGFLRKPVNREALLELLDRLLA
jgi:CheY-like chemotaxis protein